MKLKIIVLAILIIASLSGCSSGKKESFKAEAGTLAAAASSSEAEPDKLWVYVCGEVACPGVYELTVGSRVKDAIVLAGGLSPEADAVAVNQAQKLKDQDKIVVPAKNAPSGSSAGSGLMNINTATKEQLLTLPSIGEAKAAAIISYRDSHGGFKNIEELQKIEGIKSGVYNKIKDSVSVF